MSRGPRDLRTGVLLFFPSSSFLNTRQSSAAAVFRVRYKNIKIKEHLIAGYTPQKPRFR